MNNKKSVFTFSIIIGFMILSIISIRSNTRPTLYVGLILACLGVALIGMFSSRYIGALLGGVVFIGGYFIRGLYPQATSLKGDKLKTFIIENKAYNEFLDKYFIILIISFIIIGFTFGILGEKLKEERNELFKSIKLVNMSIFVALSVAINTMRVGSVSFGGFPIILSGYLLGPIPGFIVGAMSDIVGFIIRPSALGFNPVFILTSALTGLIPVVVTNLLGNKYPRFEMHKVLIGIFIGQILTSVIMVPIFSTIIYGKHSFWFLAYRAFIKQVISIPIYAFLTTTIVDRVTKVINFDYK